MKTRPITLFIALLSLLCFTQCQPKEATEITILSTNDTHSRIEAFPSNDKHHANMGGVARRMTYINSIRSNNSNVLLLDAGDFSQGTPYYNRYGASLQIHLMNQMKYDAATIGNHEFDNGMDSLAQAIKTAQFPIICSNYDLTGSKLENLTVPYLIIEKAGVKIGIIGLGVNPKGLVSEENYKGLKYEDPIEKANFYSQLLKTKGCSLIIAISHLGFEQDQGIASDILLAKKTQNIDLIMGGHTHTFMNVPHYELNKDKRQVTIIQSGYGGIKMTKTTYKIKN